MSTSSGAQRPVIVSIQSQLVYGCAGNNAAVPVLHRLGAVVYAVPTTLLSNTPHYPSMTGDVLDGGQVEDLLAGLLDRVAARDIDAILTGYIGTPEAARAAVRFIARVRHDNPAVTVLCDPVMGDLDHGLYVSDATAEAVQAELTPSADILTPNLFEARLLTGDTAAAPDALGAALLARGASVVAVTGGRTDGVGHLETCAVAEGGTWRVRTPSLPVHPTGTGDVFAAAFLHQWLSTRRVGPALEAGVGHVHALMEHCARAGGRELDPTAPVAPAVCMVTAG